MAGTKHTLDDDINQSTPSIFLPMFEEFRNELDEHQERRERVIKASRDITALGKKIIFALQRSSTVKSPTPPNIVKAITPFQTQINSLFSAVAPDLQQSDAHRYQRQISAGIQEYIEAVSFQYYLENQSIISHEEAQRKIPGGILLTEGDYLLGLFDMVGELMRFAITRMATEGIIPGAANQDQANTTGNQAGTGDMLVDMRTLRTSFEGLDFQRSGMKRDAEKKMEVMQTCVQKVETSVYGLKIRGQERPKGWMPDINTDDKREPVEAY